MKPPAWLRKDVVLVLHEELLAEFGGEAGTRDEGLLESALGRPLNLFSYEKPSLFQLAASYAFGIIKNHPFLDGNKRTGFMAAYTFLARNGYILDASEAEATAATLSLADGELTEEQYADWIKENATRGQNP